MEETLKTIRLLHQVIIALGAALLAFALSPDESTHLQKALDGLYALRELDSTKYVEWLVASRTKIATENADRGALLLFALRLKTAFGPNFEFKPAFFVEWPDSKATLRDWDSFMRFATVTRFDPALPINLDAVSKDAIVPHGFFLESISLYVAPEDALQIDAVEEYQRVAKSSSLGKDGTVTLLLKNVIGEHEIRQWKAKLVATEPGRDDFPLQWLVTEPGFCKRLYDLKPDDIVFFFKQDQQNPPVFLPAVRKYWLQIAHLPLTDAIDRIEKRIEGATHGLTLFSVSLDIVLLRWAGPIATILFLAYLAVHLRQLENFPARSREEVSSFPWIGIFRGWMSLTLLVVTLFVLPLLSSGLLLWRTTSGPLRIQAFVITGTLLLAIQWYMTRTLIRIRRRIE